MILHFSSLTSQALFLSSLLFLHNHSSTKSMKCDNKIRSEIRTTKILRKEDLCSPPWTTSFFSFGGFLGFSAFFGFSVLLASALKATPFNAEARSASEELLMFVAGGGALCVRPAEASVKERTKRRRRSLPRVLQLLRVLCYILLPCVYTWYTYAFTLCTVLPPSFFVIFLFSFDQKPEVTMNLRCTKKNDIYIYVWIEQLKLEI